MPRNLRNLGNAGAWFSALAAEAMKSLKEIRERGTAKDIDSLVENLDKLTTEARELVALVKLGALNISIGAPDDPDPEATEGDKHEE